MDLTATVENEEIVANPSLGQVTSEDLSFETTPAPTNPTVAPRGSPGGGDPGRGGPGGQNTITDGLRTELSQQAASPAAAFVQSMTPRIKKVMDPVAFMTSAKRDPRGRILYSKGNYDEAIKNLDSEKGFYEQAKAECESIAESLQSFGTIDPLELPDFQRLVGFVRRYGELYDCFQTTGDVRTWSEEAEAATNTVKAKLISVQIALQSVPDTFIGSIRDDVRRCLDEMLLFVDSAITSEY